MNPVPRHLKRGDIVSARFDPVEGSEQAGIRPAIVVSPTTVNRVAPIVILAPLTSQSLENVYSYEVIVEAGEAGLPRRSKILLLQIRSVSKSRILGHYGTVDSETLERVDYALKIAVGLTRTE